MNKIVVINDQNFTKFQKERLDKLGKVTYFHSLPSGAEEYLERAAGANIICSGTAGLSEACEKLKDVYISVPFVSASFVDLNLLSKNNVKLSNAPGSNKYAVAEWAVSMSVILMRDLIDAINREQTYRVGGSLPPSLMGLCDSKVLVLGNGQIGKLVCEVISNLGADVDIFKRGDNLCLMASKANLIINALSSNPETVEILNYAFFESMPKGSYFVNVARDETIDIDAMIKSIDEGHIAGAASDCASVPVGDTNGEVYKKLLGHPKIIVTPHVAYNTPTSLSRGIDIMIDNVEAWINGKPQNLLN